MHAWVVSHKLGGAIIVLGKREPSACGFDVCAAVRRFHTYVCIEISVIDQCTNDYLAVYVCQGRSINKLRALRSGDYRLKIA